MLPSELEGVPWPALLVSANGEVRAASPRALALLGISRSDLATLEERFEPLTSLGDPVPNEERPLRRAARSELFEVDGIWRDRDSKRELSIRSRGRPDGSFGLLEIDPIVEDAERRATLRLEKLNEALLGRTPGQGFISIRELLLQLVVQACDLTKARYGALGILRADGLGLKDFIQVGVPENIANAIGHLPTGKGLIGAAIREGGTVCVPNIAADPRSAGFPPSHPRMTSFLGVPLRLGQQVFGNFYLADKQGGGVFTEEDARLLERFSTQASLTVAYARQAEQEERRLFQIVVQQAPHGIVFFPAHTDLEAFGNPIAERLLGRLTRGNDPDRTYELNHPDGSSLTEDELPSTRALREEAVINLEVVIERHDGPVTPALMSAAPVVSESGVKLGAVVILQDITALKQLQHLRQDFMAIVAHDLRTPLQSVLMQIEALMQRAAGEVTSVPVSVLQLIKRNSQRLDRLVRDLLDASQLDSRGIHLDLVAVNLPEVASSVVSQAEGTLGSHSAVVVVVTGEPFAVMADPLRLEQILTNLLDNAAKYSEGGADIRIVIGSDGRGTAISVEDRGPGIAPAELPRLFDRYYQTQRARDKRRGLGLGLFIVKGLVEAHGGTISVESVPGTGSKFRVWLPAAS